VKQAQTMKAAVLESHSAPFRYMDVSIPEPDQGQVLVKVSASGVNPLDVKIRLGEAPHARHALPAILGMDVAGIVASVGTGVRNFREGDEVFGMVGGVAGRPGSLAEYVVADADLLALKPHNLSMRESAALPLVFITAWEGLVDRANVKAGQRVLIQGGGGGVGHIAIQVSIAKGATVFATGSAHSLELIRRLGATPIDYRRTTVQEYVEAHSDGKGFDVVYDTAGGTSLDASFQAVARFGQVISALGWGTHSLAPLSFRSASYSGVFTLLPLLTGVGKAHHGEILREAARLAEHGQLLPQVDTRRFGLQSVGEAHEAVSTGKTAGKIVVDIDH
jgi:NADPH2:quinone reductase